METIYLVLFSIISFFFIRNVLLLIFQMENIKIHKKRLKQLKFQKDKKDMNAYEMVDSITKPVVKSLLPKMGFLDIEGTRRKLVFVKWKVGAEQYIALNLMAKAVSIIPLIAAKYIDAGFMPYLYFAALFFLPGFLLNNSYNNKMSAIMMEFPDFIRIVQGYLTTGMSFEKAAIEAAPFLNKYWQEMISVFIGRVQSDNIEAGLNYLKDEINNIEVKEFISVVNLSLGIGKSAKDGFESQAEKIQQMLYDMMLIKINRRKAFGTLIQAPLLLANFAIIGIPVIHSFSGLNM